MADTGFHSPTGNNGTGNNLINPQNAYTEDGTYTTHNYSDGGYYGYQLYNTFGLGVPDGATITGIEIKVKGYCTFAGNAVRITIENVSSQQKSVALPSSNDWITFGGETELWNKTYTSANLSDANLIIGFIINVGDSVTTGYVDNFQMKVYYNTDLSVSVYDSVSVSESFSPEAIINVSEYNSISISENTNMNITKEWQLVASTEVLGVKIIG
jgi:hypothetical protein